MHRHRSGVACCRGYALAALQQQPLPQAVTDTAAERFDSVQLLLESAMWVCVALVSDCGE